MIIRAMNWLLRPSGLMVIPRPPSAKMMIEHANVSESYHPSGNGKTVAWMRTVATLMGRDRW